MNAIAQTSWNVTCKFCSVIRDVLAKTFVYIIELGESAGRARAARELCRQGMYKEAKTLMLQGAKKNV
jgi:hypothetical protein